MQKRLFWVSVSICLLLRRAACYIDDVEYEDHRAGGVEEKEEGDAPAPPPPPPPPPHCRSPATIAVWLTPGADPRAVAERNGFRRLIGQVGSLEGVYEYEIDCADDYAGDHDYAVDQALESRKLRLRDRVPDPAIIKAQKRLVRWRYLC